MSPYPLLSSRESSGPSITALLRALPLSPSFAAPPAPLGSEVARHCRQQWTFTYRLPLTGSIQCLDGRPWLCPTRIPGSWGISPPTVPLVVLGIWGGGGAVWVQLEDGSPPMILDPKSSRCLGSSLFDLLPPSPLPFPVQLHVSQHPPY